MEKDTVTKSLKWTSVHKPNNSASSDVEIKNKKPKAFLLENVKQLKGHDKGRTLEVILEHLQDIGYTNIQYKVLRARDFGLPQNRERIFIVGFKDFREFSFPKPMELKLRLGDMLQDNPKSFNLIDGFNGLLTINLVIINSIFLYINIINNH